MKRLKEHFRRPDLQLAIFVLTLFFFSWPVLSVAHDKGLLAFFLYLFGGWLVVILIILMISISLDTKPSDGPESESDGDV